MTFFSQLRCKSVRGFTLIEIMIVVAIVAILSAIALPAYTSYIKKSRRTDAIVSINNIMMLQERYRANNTGYGDLLALGVASVTADNFYDVAISGISSSGFTVTLTAKAGGSQTSDKEAGVSCTPMSVVVSGNDQTFSPSACWKK